MNKELDLQKNVYRVSGFSCSGCANTFEKNVQHLDGVVDAKVNFGASKITVYGEASLQELEKAGAFEGLKLTPEHEKVQEEKKEPFIKKNANVIVAFLLVVLGFVFQMLNGEGHSTSVISFAFAMVIGGFSLFKTGLVNLTKLQFDMKTLMTVAVIGAAIIGEWSEGAIVVILFAISEALERFSMERARNSIRSLMDIAPKEALIRRDGHEHVVSVEQITVGDTMIVKPGQKIAMDGVVRAGHSAVNQAAITGESVPVEKQSDALVFAGTLNGEGLLEIEVTKMFEDTTLSKIIHLVEEAQGERAPAQKFVDTFAKYYTPIIMLIAALVAIVPPLLFAASWEVWVYQGLAVLVVGCPCALVISTPVAIVTAIGNAAKHGVLLKGGVYLEEIGKLKAIAFDKTGTLTKGEPVVTDFITYSETMDENNLFAHIAALEHRSQHPLASAFIKKAEQEQIDFAALTVEQFSALTGKGIKGMVGGTTYFIGKPDLFSEICKDGWTPDVQGDISSLQRQGKTVMVAGNEAEIFAVIAVADEVREASRSITQALHQLGIKATVMLTGDNKETAASIGKEIGLTDIYAELMPEDKLTHIKSLGTEYGHVAMVGDGVNDAPALAAATVGIAMGGAGTDTALETADVALMSNDLKKLAYTVRLSRKALAIIKQNITLSIGIKIVALLLVVPGWLTLWIAIMADMGATLLVTLNGLRLLKVKE